ncbi:hypothetical protein [Nocardia caishijiensis]|uniref:hypothetical protein n=1 Tax=Nocardia caishijiensis TaxID=184756 RepID=UPI0012ECDDF4|nr:hypothetical protein [Nocardia caishijiensis]
MRWGVGRLARGENDQAWGGTGNEADSVGEHAAAPFEHLRAARAAHQRHLVEGATDPVVGQFDLARGFLEQGGQATTRQWSEGVLRQPGREVVAHDPVGFGGNGGLNPCHGECVKFSEHRGGDRGVTHLAGQLDDSPTVGRPIPVQFHHTPRGRLEFGDLLAPIDQGLLGDLLGDGVAVEVSSRRDMLDTDDPIGQLANGCLDIVGTECLCWVLEPEAFGALVTFDPLQMTFMVESVALGDQILDRVGVVGIRVGTRQPPGLDPCHHLGSPLGAENSDMSHRVGQQDTKNFDAGVGPCQRGGQLGAARHGCGEQLLDA